MTRLLVDVSQYEAWPAVSGVQRVLGHLAAGLAERRGDAQYGFLHEGAFVVGPLPRLGETVLSSFVAGDEGDAGSAERHASEVRARLRRHAEGHVRAGRVEASYDGYLLPEPTLSAASLAIAERLLRSARTKVFVLYYDSLPLTHPDCYPRRADEGLGVTRYHLLATRAANVAFISGAARRQFEGRLARGAVENAVVAHPGAELLDADGHVEPPGRPRFTMLGTVEPRKRYGLALAVFEELWADGLDYELVVIGARGWETAEVLDRLTAHARSGRVRWLEHAGDRAVAHALRSSSGLLFLGESEGYGLPPLEALALGCPVIVSEGLPSLEGLSPEGQIRLADPSVPTVRAALESLADPGANAEQRAAAALLHLPSWAGFADELETWIARGIDGGRSRVAA